MIPSREGWPQAGVGSWPVPTRKPTPPLTRHPSQEGMVFVGSVSHFLSPLGRGGRRPGWVLLPDPLPNYRQHSFQVLPDLFILKA